MSTRYELVFDVLISKVVLLFFLLTTPRLFSVEVLCSCVDGFNMAFVLTLSFTHLFFFWCLWKVVLRDCDNF